MVRLETVCPSPSKVPRNWPPVPPPPMGVHSRFSRSRSAPSRMVLPLKLSPWLTSWASPASSSSVVRVYVSSAPVNQLVSAWSFQSVDGGATSSGSSDSSGEAAVSSMRTASASEEEMSSLEMTASSVERPSASWAKANTGSWDRHRVSTHTMLSSRLFK